MARGWESKSVEDQQAEAGRRSVKGPALSPEERDRRQYAEGLALGLADLSAQFRAACQPAHQDMLRRRIVAIEALLAAAEAPVGPPRD
jgi:hypothetical protein